MVVDVFLCFLDEVGTFLDEQSEGGFRGVIFLGEIEPFLLVGS